MNSRPTAAQPAEYGKTTEFSAAELAAHPLFPAVDQDLARHLIAIHRETPKLARLKASHRKWLMTQSLFTLCLERNENDPLSGLTISRFIDIATSIGAVSRNTAESFIKEMLTYKFLERIPNDRDKRFQILTITDISYDAMESWFNGHMKGLDRLDGGNRFAVCANDPRIFRMSQPRAADRLVNNPVWRHPADSIGAFLHSDLGGMVLHELMSHITDFRTADDRIRVAQISITQIARTYMVSASNVKRMFKRAEDAGHLTWGDESRKKTLWLSRGFIEDYLGWQAEKFAALDEAFHWSVGQLADG
jgi:DNA-binding MarR family transcriptional regulator